MPVTLSLMRPHDADTEHSLITLVHDTLNSTKRTLRAIALLAAVSLLPDQATGLLHTATQLFHP
ncbi:hypothetical protein [Kutzneria sp. 744]|uniref:hypothetical protein n=1 Tax=Kutzneria sp. (strain 744) TaxID=345341 RepID=UPI0005BD2EFD|nr:hypothetical protein [Kutzneria sp. 744]